MRLVHEPFPEGGVGEVGVWGEGEVDLNGAGFGGGVGAGDVYAREVVAEEVRVFGGDVFVEGEGCGGLFEGEGPEVADLGGDLVAAGEEGFLAEGGFADCDNGGGGLAVVVVVVGRWEDGEGDVRMSTSTFSNSFSSPARETRARWRSSWSAEGASWDIFGIGRVGWFGLGSVVAGTRF